jgi:hypothetical protein
VLSAVPRAGEAVARGGGCRRTTEAAAAADAADEHLQSPAACSPRPRFLEFPPLPMYAP